MTKNDKKSEKNHDFWKWMWFLVKKVTKKWQKSDRNQW